jgi:hypothetical protein
MMDFDTLYYYSVDSEQDDSLHKGAIPTIDIAKDKLKIERLSENEFSIMLDVGPKKYELIASTLFIAEQWVEAIECSARTAQENRYSITGKI